MVYAVKVPLMVVKAVDRLLESREVTSDVILAD